MIESGIDGVDNRTEHACLLLQVLAPLGERVPALGGHPVLATLRAMGAFGPGGGDQAVVFEAAQEPVEATWVGRDQVAGHLLDDGTQVVSVLRAGCQRCQKRRL